MRYKNKPQYPIQSFCLMPLIMAISWSMLYGSFLKVKAASEMIQVILNQSHQLTQASIALNRQMTEANSQIQTRQTAHSGAVISLSAMANPRLLEHQSERPLALFRQPLAYLSPVERQMITEINRVRQNPTAYAAELKKLRTFYQGNLLKLPGMATIKTQEGPVAMESAIAALRRLKPRSPLTPSRGLSQGARDHAKDLGKHGAIGHYGRDRSDPFTRISRYGQWQGLAGETISYSPIHTARWHVMQLIIDDGVPSRSHRRTLLEEAYQFTGVACAPHRVYQNVCVMTYATTYEEDTAQKQ